MWDWKYCCVILEEIQSVTESFTENITFEQIKNLTQHLKNKGKPFPDRARAELFRLECGRHIQERLRVPVW